MSSSTDLSKERNERLASKLTDGFPHIWRNIRSIPRIEPDLSLQMVSELWYLNFLFENRLKRLFVEQVESVFRCQTEWFEMQMESDRERRRMRISNPTSTLGSPFLEYRYSPLESLPINDKLGNIDSIDQEEMIAISKWFPIVSLVKSDPISIIAKGQICWRWSWFQSTPVIPKVKSEFG